MEPSLRQLIESYDANAPLTEASTIPASWYIDPRVMELERRTVFSRSWQVIGRRDQVEHTGSYVAQEVAGEPIVAIRGNDQALRGFFNVCLHHAAAVVFEEEGWASQLRCPYHGWTYSLEGRLKGTPEFQGVQNFDPANLGLVPIPTAVWANWVFAKLDSGNPTIETFLGDDLSQRIRLLKLEHFYWFERRRYSFECNWKVFVDNYLDGGYHVPHLHKGLDSVLDYSQYTIENGSSFCLQSCPVIKDGTEQETGAVRGGDRALYYWIYPNFMINWYEGVLDTNLVVPLSVNRTEVIFDFYFTDVSEAARPKNLASIAVAQRIQDEDVGICESVQRGLGSRAYSAGRLSVRREAGLHHFHRILHSDLLSFPIA